MKNIRRIGGSLEQALNKETDFHLFKVLKEAWNLTLRTWIKLIGAMAIVFAISIALQSVVSGLLLPADTDPQTTQSILIFTNALILAPFMGALHVMGIRHSVGEVTKISDVFCFVKRPFALIATLFLTIFVPQIASTVLFFVNEFIAMLVALFLSVCFFMAVPLCAEYSLSPLEAVRASFITVAKRFAKFLLVGLIFMLIFALGLGTYFIAFIWFAPFLFNVVGVIYRELYGVAVSDINQLNRGDNERADWTA